MKGTLRKLLCNILVKDNKASEYSRYIISYHFHEYSSESKKIHLNVLLNLYILYRPYIHISIFSTDYVNKRNSCRFILYKYRKKCTIGQIEAKNLFLQKNLYGISFLLTSSLIFYGSSTTHKPRPRICSRLRLKIFYLENVA
uniref:Uncharacterized protein n=1 Tax=Heterorhabditis bacteriophora TaxID=37862 RepID=A0A1I7WIF5_HETBA